MTLPRMYTEFASLWPSLSPLGAYAELAERLRPLISGRTVLHLGSGGGHLLWHLSRTLEMTAVDLSEAMLERSRALNPEVPHVLADMRALRLPGRFSAVLITDALDYLIEPAEVQRTLEAAVEHLEPEGALLLVPNYLRETFPGKTLHHFTCEGVDVLEWTRPPGPEETHLETLFLFIRRDGESVAVEPDLHRMSLFPEDFWVDQVERLGMRASVHGNEPSGQGVRIFQGVFRTGG